MYTRSLILLPVLLLASVAIDAASEPTCECKSVAESFIVTRNWNIIDEEWTDQMVIDEFDRGFAPLVTHLPGFQEYSSASTGNDRTVFFHNIFDTRENAKAAQEGAKTFVQKGVLNGVITPNEFTENELEFHVAADDCIVDSFDGRFLGTEIWTIKPDVSASETNNSTIAGIAQEFLEGYAPTVEGLDGFLEYGGALVFGTDKVFFYTVFDNAQGVTDSNAGAEEFVEGNDVLSGNIEKIVFTEGTVGFDYTCAAGNLPPAEGEEVVEPEVDGAVSPKIHAAAVTLLLGSVVQAFLF